MKKQKIKKIRKLAHSIDSRINLFEGLVSKVCKLKKNII